MLTVGRGRSIAALLNLHARHVTPRVVRALKHAIPDASIHVSDDIEQARRHAKRIVQDRPDVVIGGGGDGSIVKLINLIREASNGTWLPVFAVLRLGTGNAWARVTGADEFEKDVKILSQLPWPLPTRRFDLVEVENTWCHFAGVGWDARILNDYLRNLDKRSSQLVGSRIATAIHKGLPGYLYSLFRITIPEEVGASMIHGRVRIHVENIGGEVFTLNSQAQPIPLKEPDGSDPRVLYEGPMSVAGCATEQEYGFGFRAFPFAQAVPGFFNVRIYDRTTLQATSVIPRLWRGEFPMAGMHDFFAKHVRMRFSRSVPFQIAGDGLGLREEIDYRIADRPVDLVDWTAARSALIPEPPPAT